ncbi:MAG: glycosyltransferase, partial [Bacteroidales bacterium]
MLTFIQHYLPEIFIIVFGLIIFLQFLYYFALFARFTFHKSKKIKDYHQDPVSIVITAKDEAHHLLKSLPVLLNQQYNNYEVVIVNDNSADETKQIILEYKTKYPHLKLVDLNSSVTTIKGKKFPLSLGIKSASHEIILLTDADCVPSSPYWLQNMAKH